MGAQPSHSVLIKMLSDPTPPKEDPQKAELAQQFEGNRQKLIQLSCQLKKLEWLAMNSADSSGSAGGGKRRSAEESGNSSRRSWALEGEFMDVWILFVLKIQGFFFFQFFMDSMHKN